MEPNQALALLDQAAALAPLPRAQHVQVQQAVAAILKALAAGKDQATPLPSDASPVPSP